jgi:hypothetical protein
VLHEIKRKHISQSEAAQPLKISDRHIRRLNGELEYGASWPGLRGLCVGIELANQTVAVFFLR